MEDQKKEGLRINEGKGGIINEKLKEGGGDLTFESLVFGYMSVEVVSWILYSEKFPNEL